MSRDEQRPPQDASNLVEDRTRRYLMPHTTPKLPKGYNQGMISDVRDDISSQLTKPLIYCPGLSVAGVILPQFEVVPRDYVVLGTPSSEFVDCDELMKALAGADPRIKPAGHVCETSLWRDNRTYQIPSERPLIEYLACQGIAGERGERILLHLGLESRPCGSLGYTPWLLLDLHIAWASKPDVVVFTTDGLDPNGKRAVREEAWAMLPTCAAIEVISSETMTTLADRAIDFTKIIHCGLAR